MQALAYVSGIKQTEHWFTNLVYQLRDGCMSAEIFNTCVSQHRDSLHGCHMVATGMRSEATLVIVGFENDG